MNVLYKRSYLTNYLTCVISFLCLSQSPLLFHSIHTDKKKRVSIFYGVKKLSVFTNMWCLSVNLQKLTSDLAGVEQQKKVLEMELEQWKRITLPPQTSPAAPVNTECHGKTLPASANLGPKSLEAEVKQLQGRLKVGIFTTVVRVAAFLYFSQINPD